MRHIINLDNWERKDNFLFFREFVNPCLSVTTEIDCTDAMNRAKERGESFFLYCLYAVLKASNEVKEFRYRVEEEEIVYYDTVDAMTPIKVNDDGKFVIVRIAYHEDFNLFYKEAKKIIGSVSEDTNPYEAEYKLSSTKHYDVIQLSATPNMYFTSISYTQRECKLYNYPLTNVGKVVTREGRKVLPFAMNVHHGLVDGFHIGLFFERIEANLKFDF